MKGIDQDTVAYFKSLISKIYLTINRFE